MTTEYRTKIEALLLNSVINPPQKQVVNTVIPKTSEPKLDVKLRIQDIFKIEESYDVPCYINDGEDSEINGSGYTLINPPSSFPEVDAYWTEVYPYLKRIGENIPHSNKSGRVFTKVYDNTGKLQVMHICLVKNTDDKPSIMLCFEQQDKILELSDAIRYIEKTGLKCERMSGVHLKNSVIVDVLI